MCSDFIAGVEELAATIKRRSSDDVLGKVINVSLIDLSGEASIRYSPLANLFLKAAIESDSELVGRTRVTLHNFLQGHTTAEMVGQVVAAEPDVVGYSCQGWNFRQLSVTFSTLRQFLPNATIVLGGNHVSYRGARLLLGYPDVDAIVNGEGEFTFVELLREKLRGGLLTGLPGVTFRDGERVVTTAERPRTRSMLELASPYALSDVDYSSFDVALLETNRGCPYACGFCYWGGRVGQKLAKGGLERVRAELDTIGRAGIPTLFLCDANFGILPQDVEVARLIVAAKQKYGAPDELHVNWAKSNGDRVGEILRVLDEGGVRCRLTLPLQTLSSRALAMAGRSEKGRERMIALALDLVRGGADDLCCELIFGLPGESLAEFKTNYDELYSRFPLLRIHPLWILPNTDYDRKRDEFRILTISPDPMSDYEAVISHRDLSVADVRDGLAFLLAHSILSLLGTARHTLRLLARAQGTSPAHVLGSLESFLAERTDPLGSGLFGLFARIRKACYFERSLRDTKRRLLYASRETTYRLIKEFLFTVGVCEQWRSTVEQMLWYECLLLPRNDLDGEGIELSEHTFAFDPVLLAKKLAYEGSDWREWLSDHGAPTTVVIGHESGLAKLDGRNCDLTGRWNGRVAETRSASPADLMGLST